MKKRIFTLITIMILGSFPALVFSNDDHEDHIEKRIDHYKVDKPETTAAALTLLRDKVSFIAEKLDKDILEIGDLEAVHQASYGLEAAVDFLREEQDEEGSMLDELDESVQALHYASEKHEETKTREWFLKLKTKAKEVENVFDAS